MKKLSLLLLVGALTITLTGCGAKEDVVASKSCTKQEDGYVSTDSY